MKEKQSSWNIRKPSGHFLKKVFDSYNFWKCYTYYSKNTDPRKVIKWATLIEPELYCNKRTIFKTFNYQTKFWEKGRYGWYLDV